MGQYIPIDPSVHLTKQVNDLTSSPAFLPQDLKCVPGYKIPFYTLLYSKQNLQYIQIVYKFLSNQYISIIATKKIQSIIQQDSGIFIGNQKIYGYKINKHKNHDKVKTILFKKRIFGKPTLTLQLLAQLKLLSILQLGPYLGSMLNGTDCYLYPDFLQYYTENLYHFKSGSANITEKLSKYFIGKTPNKSINFGHSKINQLVIRPQLPQQSIYSTASSITNNIDQIKLSQPQQNISKLLQIIDQKTRMLSSIQNLLFQKNIEKCKMLFQDSFKKIFGKKQKLKFIYKFTQLLQDTTYFDQYLKQLLSKVITQKNFLDQGDDNGRKFYLKKLQQKVNKIKFKTTHFNSQAQVQQFSQTCSLLQNDIRRSKLKLNIQQNNTTRIAQIMSQINITSKQNLKTTINQKYTIGVDYAILLMKSGKSRLALLYFQRLLKFHDDDVPLLTQTQICNLMGLIYYHRFCYRFACRQFQICLSKFIKMRYYSQGMIQAYNNIGCALYRQFKYQQAIQVFGKALNCKIGSNDLNLILRNNRTLTFLKMGKIQKAKQQFMKIMNQIQPINSAQALCKIYSNLGYLHMKIKPENAKIYLKFAIDIQQKCLIPNGYSPSPFLHNNMAMLRFKQKQYRQALQHFIKYTTQFQKLQSIQAFIVNFNIALAYKQCYKNQLATIHIQKCKTLLINLPQTIRIKYQKRLLIQTQKINRNVIDQVSQQSSGVVIQGMLQSLTRKN